MLEAGRKELTELGIIDKFELICADIFDTEKFQLPEQVDCVVISYAFTTFINNFDMLKRFLEQCRKQAKPDNGCCMITDFSYMKLACDNFWAGMYTTTEKENTPPGDFEIFNFTIDQAPDWKFKIFNIPSHVVMRAALEAGFNGIEFKLQYPDPEVKDDPVVRRYQDECNPTDYLMKLRVINN